MSELDEVAPNTLVPPRGAKLDWLKIAAQVVSSRNSGCGISAINTISYVSIINGLSVSLSKTLEISVIVPVSQLCSFTEQHSFAIEYFNVWSDISWYLILKDVSNLHWLTYSIIIMS